MGRRAEDGALEGSSGRGMGRARIGGGGRVGVKGRGWSRGEGLELQVWGIYIN